VLIFFGEGGGECGGRGETVCFFLTFGYRRSTSEGTCFM